ncbi:MAG: carbohydrate kinase [Clostridiales bacterium]|nr:carbohydrate kinase [Clostridiales bacterium]
MGRIVGFGECVIDFIPKGTAEDGSTIYQACPGGSVANLCVAAARLGQESAFIGQVGDDRFGHFLQERLAGYGVDTEGMTFSGECGTFLVFVHPLPNGERAYSFSNRPGADKLMRYGDVKLHLIDGADIVHFASCAMSGGETQITASRLIRYAHGLGKIVSYDVNYRELQYDTVEEARRVARIPIGHADIVKATEEELKLVTGRGGAEGVADLLESGAKIVLVTRGSAGSSFYIAGASGSVSAPRVEAVDTVGAGDCYLGAFLSRIADRPDLRAISPEQVREAAEFAGRAAALSVTRWGAMASMPLLSELT